MDDKLDCRNNAFVLIAIALTEIMRYCIENSSADTVNFYHFMQYPHGSVLTAL